jgi:glycosyltransferase involved in cell wall biosynthesis
LTTTADLRERAGMKTLSVILLNYNQAHWLRRSLCAHAEQADERVEIIVVDDGSADGSAAVIERMARTYAAIRPFRHAENRGIAAGLQTGLAAATGEFLLFAASDDLVLPGLFRSAVAALRAHPDAALFCSGTVLIDADDGIVGFRPVTWPRETAGYVSPAEVRHAIRRTDNWFIGSSVVYRRAHLQAIGTFDENLGSLSDGLANRLLAFRHGFYFEPKVLSAWRRYADSYSSQVAMTPGASEASLDKAARWIAARYPADVRDWYGPLFDRRYRYNLARLRLIWGGGRPDGQELAAFLRLGAADAAMLRLLARIPVLNTKLIIAWITLRLRPFALSALATAWWRSITVNRAQHSALQQVLNDTPDRKVIARHPGAVRAQA